MCALSARDQLTSALSPAISALKALKGLEIVPYLIDRLVLMTSPQHALAAFDKASFIDTLGHDQVCLGEASAISSFLAQVASEYHKSLRTRTRVGNVEGACKKYGYQVCAPD